MSGRAPRIWVEVDDYLRNFDWSLTPTGIDRVQSEIFPHLADLFPERVRFVRLGRDADEVATVPSEKVNPVLAIGGFLQKYRALPGIIPVWRVARFLARRGERLLGQLRRTSNRRRFERDVLPGDVLINIGASWTHHDYAATVAELKRRHGLRFALMVHDILPVTHPQFVSPTHIPGFTKWLRSMADVVDMVLTPSVSSAVTFKEWATREGFAPTPVRPVPFGAGFGSGGIAGESEGPPRARQHVLYVSTIEVRKNHILLFRVWEQLIARHGADKIPQLLFVGKYGWEIDALKAALAESRFLDGKIRVAQNVSDEQLAECYRDAMFTLFPSFCEGWGLPVGESLRHGRYCIASNATSIPEVGGEFVAYHQPGDTEEACRLVEQALFEPGYLDEMERRIREHYRPRGWDGTARAIVAEIDQDLAAASASFGAGRSAPQPQSPDRADQQLLSDMGTLQSLKQHHRP